MTYKEKKQAERLQEATNLVKKEIYSQYYNHGRIILHRPVKNTFHGNSIESKIFYTVLKGMELLPADELRKKVKQRRSNKPFKFVKSQRFTNVKKSRIYPKNGDWKIEGRSINMYLSTFAEKVKVSPVRLLRDFFKIDLEPVKVANTINHRTVQGRPAGNYRNVFNKDGQIIGQIATSRAAFNIGDTFTLSAE